MEKDLFLLLQTDHERMMALFDELERQEIASDATAKTGLYRQLRQEWREHSAAEEAVLYPFLQRLPQADTLVKEAMQAHDGIDTLFEELDLFSPWELGWLSRFEQVRAEFDQHLGREEGDIFPYLRRFFTEGELKMLGERLEQIRGQIHKSAEAA
jgi:hemerythrin superfamily protein